MTAINDNPDDAVIAHPALAVVRRTRLRLRAAVHEVRCAECRVSWSSWLRRIGGGR